MSTTVVDNVDAGYAETGGGWAGTSSGNSSMYGVGFRYAGPSGNGSNTASWTFTGLSAGVRVINEVREERNLPAVPWGDVPRWVYELDHRAQAAADLAASMASDPNADPNAADPNVDPMADNANGRDPNGQDRPGDQTGDGASRSRNVVRAKGSPFNRKVGRRSLPSPKHDEAFRTLIRGIGKSTARDYERLKGECIPVLKRYFGKQKDRIIENVKRIYSGRLDDAARSIIEVEKQIFCITARGTMHARLFLDGTTVNEIGQNGYARLGEFVTPKLACGGLRDGEFSFIKLRKIDEGEADELDDWQKSAEALADAMLPKLGNAMEAGGESQAGFLDLTKAFDLESPKAREWLENKQRDYWRKTVNATTKQLLSEKLSEVMKTDPTIDKLVEAVELVMDGRIKSSAETIARTEVVGAYNAGSSIIRREAGVEQKQWVSTNDDRTRDAHLDADGQTVSEYADFIVDGEALEYPGDPSGSVSNIVNCRCTAVAVIE